MMLDPNSNRFTYAYDPAGRLASLVNPEGDRTTFSYDAAGQRTRQLQANGVSTSYTYDDAGRLTQLASYNPAGTPLTSFDYRYDSAANRTGVTEVDGTLTTWSYDRTYQLTAEHRGGTYHTTYTYDPVGNRLVKNDSGALTTSTYDAANQLQTSQDASGTTNYAYDLAGNLRTSTDPAGGITTHTWDDENRRTRVALPSGVVNTSTYNGDGLRVTRQDSTGTTNFIWDGQAYLLEYTDSDVTIFTQEPSQYGGLVSQAHADFANYIYVPHYYLHDALGSTAKLTDAAAQVTDSYLYKAFGEIVQSTGTTHNPFLWVGAVGYYADLDLLDYYLRARVYTPAIASFLTQDPLGFAAGAIGLHRYTLNRPTRLIDPSGLRECLCDCRGLAPSTALVNSIIDNHLLQAIRQFGRGNRTLPQVIRDAFAADDPNTGRLKQTAIEVLLYNRLRAARVPSINKGPPYGLFGRLANLGTADCILLVCRGQSLCIGTDKIGHFFQQGFMLWEIATAKGEDYARAFSYWSEGDYEIVQRDYYKQTARRILIDSWLSTGEFTFYGSEFSGRTKVSSYKNTWGGRVGAPTSFGDKEANVAGLSFWQSLDDYLPPMIGGRPVAGPRKKAFDICDFVTPGWAGR